MSGDTIEPEMGDVNRKDPQQVKRSRARIGFVIGMVLLAGAAVYLLADPQTVGEFVEHLQSAPLWAAIVVIVGPIVNWLFVGLCLHALMRRHGMVGVREMLELVGSAWLLNHLPMRPGLVGRIGYHAKVNQIRVRDSISASIWSMIHAAIANAIALGLMLIVAEDTSLPILMLILSIPVGVFAISTVFAFLHSDKLGYLMLGLVFRNADLLVWMVRYAAAFAILGITITPMQIVLITAVSQIAQVIPITGGGLGTREWGVGFVAKMTSTGAQITLRTAILADLINRVAETIIVIPLGLVCTALVTRRFRAHQREQDGNQGTAGTSNAVSSEESAEDQPRSHP